MALRREYSLIPSEFNEFLFASVGEEKNGMQLTVLSALTRLGLDPWGEAARLSNLPGETATRALAAAIAVLPEGDWRVSDAGAIAGRLVNYLPGRGTSAVRSPQSSDGSIQNVKSGTPIWLIGIMLAVAVLFAMSHLHTDHAPQLDSNAASSTQR